jgi:hypothetical protein
MIRICERVGMLAIILFGTLSSISDGNPATYVMPPTRKVVVAICGIFGMRLASSSSSHLGTLMYVGAMILFFKRL